MNPALQRYLAEVRLENRIKGRYYRLLGKGIAFSAEDLARGRNPEGFTEFEIRTKAKEVMLDLYAAMERRTLRRFMRR